MDPDTFLPVGTLLTIPPLLGGPDQPPQGRLHAFVVTNKGACGRITVKPILGTGRTYFPAVVAGNILEYGYHNDCNVQFYSGDLLYPKYPLKYEVKAAYLYSALLYTKSIQSMDPETAYGILLKVKHTLGTITNKVMRFYLSFFLCEKARAVGLHRDAAKHLEPILSEGVPFYDEYNKIIAEYTLASAWIGSGEIIRGLIVARNILGRMATGDRMNGYFGNIIFREVVQAVLTLPAFQR